MRRYETIIISDPDLSAEDRESLFERLKELISPKGGFLLDFDEWGIQKLAYEIRKKVRGHYIRLDYCGTGMVVSELERFCRINKDRILKYLTVLLDKEADLDELKAELKAKSAEAEEKASPPAKEDQEAAAKAEPEEAAPATSDDAAPESEVVDNPPTQNEKEEDV